MVRPLEDPISSRMTSWRTIAARRWMIAALVLLSVCATALKVILEPRLYEAQVEIIALAPAPEGSIGLSLLDCLSGAHPHGSRLYALMQQSEERLYQPLKDFVLTSYGVTFELDGIMALVPKSQDNSELSEKIIL